MSDLGAGIPIGMSIGIGAGIGIGKKAGQKEIAKKIHQLSANHEIRIRKPDGNYMSLDEFIENIGISDKSEGDKKKMKIVLALGILIFVLGVVTFYLWT